MENYGKWDEVTTSIQSRVDEAVEIPLRGE
jgi:hypothetical protein